MQTVRLGKTEIVTNKNGFGALPIQRISDDEAVKLLRKAYDGGMTFFDTARLYTDSEHKIGLAFEGMRDRVFISSKTAAVTPDAFWKDLGDNAWKFEDRLSGPVSVSQSGFLPEAR